MENTLDSIRPSGNPQEEMSYLFGRDPSILAYSQRPLPSKDTKKNLLSLYEVEENNSITESTIYEHSESLQTVRVYFRLKPFPKKLKLTEEQQDAYKIINSTTLVTKIPTLDNTINSIKQSKNNEIISRKFIFSQTFGPETTQLELFEQTVQQQMVDFLAGHSCTIMTYGTTNSGKSYTLQGTTTSPGLIPRALEFVFSNIITRPNPSYKPLHYCNVIGLNALERAQELEAKTKLLTFSSVDKHQYINAYKQMQKLLQEESVRPSQCHDAHYSIWVSFAEIYNEIVYDLLSNECQKKRVPLKLGTDSGGRAFIKGLKTIYVNSAAEAYQVLMAGQYNLKIAATALNAKSSRSHCIFTITLLKYCAENLPDTVEVSTFSFCDLAGSERLKKTLNIGDRLKEAQNINTSLLVLGRCLKSIHEGQLTRAKTDAVGPFRESKLTRLFQRALSGKEHLALIVNVNPLPNLYIETQNVLNFAAIAKRIVIEEKKQAQTKSRSRFSQIVTQSMETATDWNATELESVNWQQTDAAENASEYASSEEYMDLVNENEKLKKEIAVLKNSALSRDLQSRQEMAEKYITMINELEIYWKQRVNDAETQHEDTLEWTVKQVQEFYEEKLNQLHRKKRRRIDCADDSEQNSSYLNVTFDFGEEYAQLNVKNETLKKKLAELRATNEILMMEKNRANFELGLSREDLKVVRNLLEAARKDICLNQNGKFFAEEMTSQLLAKDEHIIKLKEFLNEAKTDYITVTSDLRKKELRIDEQTKIIIENEEKIEDLELHLEEVNMCLMEKTRMMEVLEEKFEHQNEVLSDAQNQVSRLQEEIERLKDEKLALFARYEEPIAADTEADSQCINRATNISALAETSCTAVAATYIVVKEELIVADVSHAQDTPDEMESAVATVTASAEADSKENPEPLEILPSNVACDKLLRTTMKTGAVGDQIDIKAVENRHDVAINLEKSICYESTQTGAATTITTATAETQTNCEMTLLKEEAVQTNDIFHNDKLQLEELATRYEEECLKVKQLTEEFYNVKKILQSFKEENQSSKTVIDEYRRSTEILEKQLSLLTEEKRKLEEALFTSNATSEAKLAEYTREIDRLEKNLAAATDDTRQYLEILETTRKELDEYASKCKVEREEEREKKSNKFEFRIKKENDTTSVKQLDENLEKIEANLETVAKLKEDIVRLNEKLEICQVEKDRMQNALEQNNKKLWELENRFEGTALKEEEKDTEIATLQKELKRMIHGSENAKRTDDRMEAELKSAISELTQTKEALSEKEQHIKELKIHLENFERNAKIFDLLEENAKERQVDNERLRNINDELRSNLTQKEREMDAFVRNRDETMTKYEALVKNQQEELDRQKREVMRYQELFRRQMTTTPNKDDYKKLQNRVQDLQDKLYKYEAGAKAKDYYDTASEDEVSTQRQPKGKRGKKAVLSTKQEDIPVIELSGSESKRSAKRVVLPTATTTVTAESSTDKRRTTRKKKLFITTDSFADIEPLEEAEAIPSTPLPTRTLRSRKK